MENYGYLTVGLILIKKLRVLSEDWHLSPPKLVESASGGVLGKKNILGRGISTWDALRK